MGRFCSAFVHWIRWGGRVFTREKWGWVGSFWQAEGLEKLTILYFEQGIGVKDTIPTIHVQVKGKIKTKTKQSPNTILSKHSIC